MLLFVAQKSGGMKMNSAMATQKAKPMTVSRQMAISGLVTAAYIAMMMLTQGFAFGQYQIRIATSLYALSAIYPFLIIPLAVGNMLSNLLLGGLGLADVIGGGIVGLMTASLVYLVPRWRLNDWLIAIPIIFCPGLLVPVWLSYLIPVPYEVLAVSLLIGQIIPGIAGVILVKQLRSKLIN
jgi:uncharacterized membrane protein